MTLREKTIDLGAMEAFTDAYRAWEDAPVAIREAMCLRAQFPAILDPIEPGDLFAGRISPAAVGFRHGTSVGEIGYYCDQELIRTELAEDGNSPEERGHLKTLLEYWEDRTTLGSVHRRMYPPLSPETERALVADDISPSNPYVVSYASRLAGLALDFDKLLASGIPGLAADIARHRHAVGTDDTFYRGLQMSLQLLEDVCWHYAAQARKQAAALDDMPWRSDLIDMAEALERLPATRPATLREAIQLFWLYALLSGVDNFGRIDVYLGDFYAADLEAGRLTEDGALRLLEGLWRLIEANIRNFSGRVIVGGVGRRNPENADRFALLALTATERLLGLLPQLSVRCHRGMNPQLWARSLDLLGQGLTYPILYNDDAFVPASASAFGVSREEAEQYIVSDCGDHSLEHRSLGSPNGNINLAKALEVTLFNGYDPVSGQCMGLQAGGLVSFASFEELWEAYAAQVEHFVCVVAERIAPLYETMAEAAPFLFESLLIDDCLAQGRGVFGGGARYRGVLVETYGNITTANSLTAIKRLVYDEKVISPEELLQVLEMNFEGHERERLMMLNAPKYGNDNGDADAMAATVHAHMASAISAQAERIGLDFCLADMINVDGHILLGQQVGATPDGRFARAPLTNANSPSVGSDTRGPTALLNSLVKLDLSEMGGQVQYLKFSRELFNGARDRLDALLKNYFAQGGNQAMITVVARGDLEAAMREPEKYRHLTVRVGGFSARFVDLPRATQEDILARTLH